MGHNIGIWPQCGDQVTMWGSGQNVRIRSQCGASGHNVGIRSQCGGSGHSVGDCISLL